MWAVFAKPGTPRRSGLIDHQPLDLVAFLSDAFIPSDRMQDTYRRWIWVGVSDVDLETKARLLELGSHEDGRPMLHYQWRLKSEAFSPEERKAFVDGNQPSVIGGQRGIHTIVTPKYEPELWGGTCLREV